MLDKIFPKQVNNEYEGSLIAKYALLFIISFTIVRSLLHMFLHDGGSQSIASIPLNTFTTPSQAVIILMFALWGAEQLLMSFVYIVVFWRYQKLIPFMYIMIFLEYSMRHLLAYMKPIVTLHTAPGAILDHVMWPLSIILFFLSLRKRKTMAVS